MKSLEKMMGFYEWKDVPEDAPLSEQEKERILKQMLEKAGLRESKEKDQEILNLDRGGAERKRKSFGLKPGRRLLMVAVCFLLIAIGTVSFAGIALDENLLTLFQPQNEQQLSSLSQLGTAVEQSVESNGSILTVRQAVSDEHTVYVTMDFTAPEGTVLDGPYYSFQDIWIQFPELGNMPCGYHMESLPDEDPLDNKVSFLLCFNGEKRLRGEKMMISLGGLKTTKSEEEIAAIKELPPMTEPGTPGDEYDWEKVVVEGLWEVEFQLSDQNSTAVFRPNETISLFGGQCKIKKVEISPISITIEAKGKAIQDYDSVPPENLENEQGENGLVTVFILMKDGSCVEFNDGSQGIIGKKLTVTKTFGNIVDPAEISAVIFGENEISIK